MNNVDFTTVKEVTRANIAAHRPVFIDFLSWNMTARQMQEVMQLLREGNYTCTKETLLSIVPERRELAKQFKCNIPQMEYCPKDPGPMTNIQKVEYNHPSAIQKLDQAVIETIETTVQEILADSDYDEEELRGWLYDRYNL